MPGRNPNPSNLHALRGNPGKRQHKAAPVIPLLTEIPRPLRGLDQFAAEKWKTVCRLLIERRLLAEMYLDAVANYCRDHSVVRHSDEILKEEGHYFQSGGQTIRHPAIQTRMDAMKRMMAFEDRFGMNALASGKVVAPAPAEKSGFMKLLDDNKKKGQTLREQGA